MAHLDDALRYLRQQVLPDVHKHGWAVHGHTVDPTELAGNITYTVGLTEAGMPELAICALPQDQAAVVLNAAAGVHINGGIALGQWVTLAQSFRFMPVDAPGVVGPVARSLYGRQVRFWQLLWPDPLDGLLPTDERWDRCYPKQPVWSQPLPEELLPTGDGLVGHLDEVARRRLE
jgi:Domain of unknown function (DUF4262)